MIDRLSDAATIAVRHAGAYTDLILSDLNIGTRALRRRMVVAFVMGAAILLAVATASAWAIAASWDTPAGPWVIGGLLALFVVIALLAFWQLTALNAAAPPVLSQTTREWAKDRELLEELLARERAEAS
jgi:uncharacterized membrane protein YqjE